jgi:hypothetical protein
MKNAFEQFDSIQTATIKKALKTVISLSNIEPKNIPKSLPHPTILERQTAEELLSAMNEKTDLLQMLDEV